jgi:hypothetical protein
MSVVKISVQQLLAAGAWVNSESLSSDQLVTIRVEPTGIGTAVTVSVETAEGEGIWKDLTDYDRW